MSAGVDICRNLHFTPEQERRKPGSKHDNAGLMMWAKAQDV